MPSRSVSVEDLLNAIKEECERLGRAPTRTEMDNDGPYHSSTYVKKIGSWGEALARVGYEPVHEVGLSKSDLIEELDRLGEELGRPPRVEDMQTDGKYSETPYAARFENWNAALEEAGFEPTHYREAINIACSTCGTTVASLLNC